MCELLCQRYVLIAYLLCFPFNAKLLKLLVPAKSICMVNTFYL
ncbi:hypothetical protein GCWU000342_00343 [Shuttleworthella satelles DSM 14600]|uniref:Uncharacterized protein n=1 Tax=Shuttleworthella satelles DSM 14600 TaxID=626523 RepID=C4G8P6_9FIRM|nr:hypothetical protein GCWU000342_00343 [Shuttleworthia satelles DSM 14600]